MIRKFGTKIHINTIAWDSQVKDYVYYKVPIENLFSPATKYYLVNDFPGEKALEDLYDSNFKLVSKSEAD